MITYAFILGRKHLLSIAELCNTLPPNSHIIDIRKEALIATLPDALTQPQDSLNRLGGTMKIAEVFAEVPSKADPSHVSSVIGAHLLERFKDRESKLSYGLSVYSFAEGNEKLIKKTLMAVKKELKSAGIKSRFINRDFHNLENAAIKGEKLIEDGAEIIVINGRHKMYIAETKALQDFENYSYRDYERPERDARLGMLPPKLAQIMINLSGLTTLDQPVNPRQTIYDPFVGVGTIPTEALILGYSVVGSDISPEIVQKTEKNIEWTKLRTYTKDQHIHLFIKDATALTKADLLPVVPDAIVTETYLGPPLTTFPGQGPMKKNFAHIQELLYRFFKALHLSIPPKTPIIFTLPFYREKNKPHFVEELIEKIEQLGFHVESPIPKDVEHKFDLPSYKRKGLVYDRPDQIVGREVWKLTSR